jgi:glyceraldehyde 3-phosphate dehydrogenase
MAHRIAINGFGRIGRAFFRLAESMPDIEVVAVNDLADIENLAYLLSHDTAYGAPSFPVGVTQIDAWRKVLTVAGRDVPVFCERNPKDLPWGEHNIDVVLEATGIFTDYVGAKAHLDAGARRVVISAPAKGDPADAGIAGGTLLCGTTDAAEFFGKHITSNGSCTTNACAPMVSLLQNAIGIEQAMLNTIHAYTATQGLVDGPDKKDYLRGRAAAQNIVPSSTGAAKAVTQVLPALTGKFDGIAMRVPVVAGSVADVTFAASRETTVEEVNDVLRSGAQEERFRNIFAVSDAPLVSSDIIGNTTAGIADLTMTRVVGGRLVKVCAWYDNEMGYTGSLVEHVRRVVSTADAV